MTVLEMNKELKGFYDGMDFVKNPDKEEFESCVGDDTDSLTSSLYYKHLTDVEIGGFFDFSDLYESIERDTSKRFVGMDMSLVPEGFKCWDNHIVLGNEFGTFNSQCANINLFHKNNASTKSEYHKKYAGSTALQMFAYYDGKPTKTVEGALIWLSIDSGFKGHYNEKFKQIHNGYLEELGLSWMIDVLNKYTYSELNKLMNDYGLNSKMKLNPEGKLINVGKWMKNGSEWKQGKALDIDFMEKHLGFSFELPTDTFELKKQLFRESSKVSEIDFTKLNKENIFSLAFTYNDQVEFTTLSKGLY